MARGRQCVAHVHRTLIPVERHHLQPQSRGGPTIADNLIDICANTHGNVHYLLDDIEGAAARLMGVGGTVTADNCYHAVDAKARASFSPVERLLARRGWNRYAAAFLAGTYRQAYEEFTSAGYPRIVATTGGE